MVAAGRGGALFVTATAALALAAGAAAAPAGDRGDHRPARVEHFDAERVGQGVLLRWFAAADGTTLGYNVFRRVAGHRVRVNEELIPSADGRGHVYRWLDRTSNQRAHYWLQVVRSDGTRSWRAQTIAG